MSKYEMIGNHQIFLDQIYFIAYAGGSRELPEKQQKEWNKTLTLPYLLQKKEQDKISKENNPNLVPLPGRKLVEFIKDLGYIPFFSSVDKSMLQLTDIVIFESMKQKSYEIALKT
jgi:hypothetical protein